MICFSDGSARAFLLSCDSAHAMCELMKVLRRKMDSQITFWEYY
jgi:hypothetical protein